MWLRVTFRSAKNFWKTIENSMNASADMTTDVRAVRYSEILDAPNAQALLAEYADECSLPELVPIIPQREMYAMMERSGAFQCFGAYVGDRLAGFGSALTYVVPHYGRRIATVESLFLAEADRRWRTGNRLMDALENYGREQGCLLILYNAPAGSQFEKLLRMLKPYRHSNTVFLRVL